ncbi:MAG: cupin domain-containing protein [Parvularculaceae bacterium]
MNEKFALDFSIDALMPEVSAPAADRVLAGVPRFRTWEIETDAGGLFAGVWEGSPGKWRIEYTEWEYCRILSGVSVVTEAGLAPRRIAAGDSLIIRPGFKGTWEVLETTRKEYVIRL